jgi:type IV fimbrial biogenesis protein FimT
MKIKKHSGFTLIEGMVTLSVIAVLLSTGVPSFSAMIKNNRLTSENHALRAVLATARFEAKAQRATVTVCRSTNAVDCSVGDWADGYIAFIDLDEDGHVDSGEQLLERHTRDNQGVAVSYSQVADILQFDSSGYATDSNGTFTFCDNRGATEARGLVVSAVGVMRTARVSEKEGSTHIVQDHVGNDVTCDVS